MMLQNKIINAINIHEIFCSKDYDAKEIGFLIHAEIFKLHSAFLFSTKHKAQSARGTRKAQSTQRIHKTEAQS